MTFECSCKKKKKKKKKKKEINELLRNVIISRENVSEKNFPPSRECHKKTKICTWSRQHVQPTAFLYQNFNLFGRKIWS